MDAGAGAATTRDGRRLEYLVEGDPDGLPLVLHHGTPGAGVSWPKVSETCRERGLALVMYTRAGYGGSTRRAGRTVADVAADIADLLDHLGQDRFLSLGWSGGGPHSLACAALLPDRCLAAATGAGVAPYLNDGTLDFLEGMGPENHVEFGAALRGLDELVPYLEKEAAELRSTSADEIGAALGGLVSDVDKAFATGEFATHLHTAFQRATQEGIWGWADDDLAFTRSWGFALDDVTKVPVSAWQGREDRMVPFSHGIYLADRLPGARRHLYDDEGHLSLNGRMGDILDDLQDLAGASDIG
ncbi:MAG: alpha/beta hydrolase [Nocardioidaceae bacterium]|nr:alpha/beta hydrolase [Nocardioidaceae bacterium]NUS52831.1 alpha/beta hydrolase [Nocardioidaceae bacterium]